MQIAVVDLGVGNLRSVKQAVTAVSPNADVILSNDESVLMSADKLVLPGQGAVGTWFQELEQRGLMPALTRCLQEKPVLGICVGMQALFEQCEEDGGQQGLGLFQGSVKHFRHFHKNRTVDQERLKIPQMGWNQVKQSQDHPLWENINDNSYFYFVHSFCANMNDHRGASDVFGCADFGHEFVAAVGRDNVFAVQFHPEKSHDDGLKLLKNFTNWKGQA